MEQIETYEPGISKAILGKILFCKSCSHCVEVSENWTLHAKSDDLSQLSNPSIENILAKLIEDARQKHQNTYNCKQSKVKTNGQEKLIIMTIDTPNKVLDN